MITALYPVLRPILFALPPETAHGLTIAALKWGLAPAPPTEQDPILTQALFGMTFSNPLGLAAGFDKNAEVPHAMLALGFGFVEVGTLTPRPQEGNPRPRIFRLREDRALINRLGFNNQGLGAALERLRARSGRLGPIGINLGANKDSADKAADYVRGLQSAYEVGDYFTINISSPNTPGLRGLQERDALADLLESLVSIRARLAGSADPKPLLLKVAPDLREEDVYGIAETVMDFQIDGLIVSNTTVARPETLQSGEKGEGGGLSGAPLRDPSTALLAQFYRASNGRVPLVGVGGVSCAQDAYDKIRAGASLVQLYTGLVYEGPGLPRRIVSGLADLLRAGGYRSVIEAVGAQVRERQSAPVPDNTGQVLFRVPRRNLGMRSRGRSFRKV